MSTYRGCRHRECIGFEICKHQTCSLVSDAELDDPKWFSDAKEAMRAEDVSPSFWVDHLSNLYRDYPGQVVTAECDDYFLDLEQFDYDQFPHAREWFRNALKPLPVAVRHRLRREARERYRVIFTILRATHPSLSQHWGCFVANDNCECCAKVQNHL